MAPDWLPDRAADSRCSVSQGNITESITFPGERENERSAGGHNFCKKEEQQPRKLREAGGRRRIDLFSSASTAHKFTTKTGISGARERGTAKE